MRRLVIPPHLSRRTVLASAIALPAMLSAQAPNPPASLTVDGPPPGGQGHVRGAFVIDPNNVTGNANDRNNGILIADGGTGAWASFAAAVAAQAGFSPGQTVIEMMGFDVMTSAYTLTAGGGSDSGYFGAKIVVRAYPGYERRCGFDCVGNTAALAAQIGNGDGPIHMKGANWRFEDLRFRTDYVMFTDGGAPGTHFVRCLQQDDVSVTSSSDNTGVIKWGSSIGLLLDEVVIRGHHRAGANAAGFYIRLCEKFWIRRSIIQNRGGGAAIYYKHPQNAIRLPGDCLIEDSLLSSRNAGRGPFHGACNNVRFRHVIFDAASSSDATYNGDDGGSDGAGINHRNDFEYCTFMGNFNNFRPSSNIDPHGTLNRLRNSVVRGDVTIWEYLTGNHNMTLDWNSYANPINEFGSTYSLSAWRSHYGQDANSVAGIPSFASTPDPDQPSTYRLANGSVGKGVAENGGDMGANVSRVGPQSWAGW